MSSGRGVLLGLGGLEFRDTLIPDAERVVLVIRAGLIAVGLLMRRGRAYMAETEIEVVKVNGEEIEVFSPDYSGGFGFR